LLFLQILSKGKAAKDLRYTEQYFNDNVSKTAGTREEVNQKAEWYLKEYGNSILRVAYSYLHNLNDAEDVLQDTLIQYMKTTPCFENSVHEKAWMIRVAINISKNKIKFNKHHGTLELDENLAEMSLDYSFVWEAVKSLPTKYSEVIHLFYQEGYSTAQIAELLSKKESTVRSLLHRSREQLKDILQKEYDFAE
jgi:RNA polymerase sigma factor, sigma-70 family